MLWLSGGFPLRELFLYLFQLLVEMLDLRAIAFEDLSWS